MKILLIGEFSRLHNSLKEGLISLGHEVTLAGTSDGFKNFPVDLDYGVKFLSKPIFKPLVKVTHKFFGFDLFALEHYCRFKSFLPDLKNFDVVQIINENSIKTTPTLEKKLLHSIFSNNRKVFLLSCGTDYISVKYAHDQKFKYSILTPYFEKPELKNYYQFILKKISKKQYQLHQFIYNHITGVIASDMDYHLPLLGHPKYLGMIPNPINSQTIKKTELDVSHKIIIFHGVNRSNYFKKGNDIFENALELLREKYASEIEIIQTEDVPYQKYIESYNKAHIILDQVYAYDQGYNALEAMAKGKVVFTGAEEEWLNYYQLEEDAVAINALPDSQLIFKKLEWLVTHPDKILEISKNARNFIVSHHDYKKIAQNYVAIWNSN